MSHIFNSEWTVDAIKTYNNHILKMNGLIKNIHYEFVDLPRYSHTYVYNNRLELMNRSVNSVKYNNIENFINFIKNSESFIIIYNDCKFDNCDNVYRYDELPIEYLNSQQQRYFKLKKLKNNIYGKRF